MVSGGDALIRAQTRPLFEHIHRIMQLYLMFRAVSFLACYLGLPRKHDCTTVLIKVLPNKYTIPF